VRSLLRATQVSRGHSKEGQSSRWRRGEGCSCRAGRQDGGVGDRVILSTRVGREDCWLSWCHGLSWRSTDVMMMKMVVTN
jgi:hypothetical protein